MNKVFRSVRSLETEEMLSVPIYRHDLANVAADQPFYLRLLIVTDDTDKQRMFTRIRRYIVDNNIGYMARFEVAVVAIGVAVAEAPSYEKVRALSSLFRLSSSPFLFRNKFQCFSPVF